MRTARTAAILLVLGACMGAPPPSGREAPTSFFITSAGPGNGADLGGLAGADAHCAALAEAAGIDGGVWHAYLSATASGGRAAVHARDRIGPGPWHNARGVMVARDVEHLHGEDNALGKETALTERGEMVNGRGDSPNMHDILTGSALDGTAIAGDEDTTCGNWTSRGEGSARVGHHDRQGGGENPTSWNSAHGSRGCGQEDLQGTGGNGLFYCFAADGAPTPTVHADHVEDVVLHLPDAGGRDGVSPRRLPER